MGQPQVHEQPNNNPISTSNVSTDSWKADYDEQVRAWHAESAEARARAVKERTRWEVIRAAEKEKAALEPHESEWESVAKKDEGSALVPGVPEANVRHSMFCLSSSQSRTSVYSWRISTDLANMCKEKQAMIHKNGMISTLQRHPPSRQ